MPMDRKLITRKGQHLVSLPAAIRAHLKTAPGVVVYWRIARRGEAVLSMKARAGRGPERAPAECPNCAAKDRDVARWKARAEARDLTLYGQGVAQGSMATYERLTAPNGRAATEALRLHGRYLLTQSRSARRKDARARPSAPPARPVETVLLPGEKPPFPPYPTATAPGEAADVTGPA